MGKILILTNNILSEVDLQQQIQKINHEVYCTGYSEGYIKKKIGLIHYFDCIIISETLSESECKTILNSLEEESIHKIIFRRIEQRLFENSLEPEFDKKSFFYLKTNVCLEELREKLVCELKKEKDNKQLINNFEKKVKEKIYLIHFTNNEKKVLDILYKNAGEIVSREVICQQVWGEEVTNSTLSQLSVLIRKIKKKLKLVDIEDSFIEVVWGKGYVINEKISEQEKIKYL